MRTCGGVLAFLLVVSLSSATHGQMSAENADLGSVLRDASEQWLCVGKYQKPHGDCVEFRSKYLVDQFFEVDEAGIVRTKSDILATESTDHPVPGAGPYPDAFQLRAVYGDFAMTVDHTAFKTPDAEGRLVFTSDAKVLRLFVRQGGQWRPAGAATVPIVPPPLLNTGFKGDATNGISPDARLEKHLEEIDQKWINSVGDKREKVDYLNQLFTDQWYEVLGWNPTADETKSRLLDSIAKSKSEPGLGVFSDEFRLMAVHGNVALATDRRTRKSVDANGHVVSSRHRSLLVFVKEGQEWRSAGGAVVPIAQPSEH
jgi:hypothetical protein